MIAPNHPDKLMLLDTASLYFRAYFGVPESLTAPDGTPNNAIRGLLDFIARLVTDRRPTHLVACDDYDWRPDFRVAALPSYKAHRVLDEDPEAEQVPDTLAPQVPVIWDVLDAIGFACVGVDGHEADDVIGTLATHATLPVDVVTGDRDLFQLVDDARKVRILYTARGVGKHEIVDESVVAAKYGIPGRSYADFALLRGDPSDGLPGVPGIGDKSAASLITRYETLSNLLAAIENGDPAIPRGQHTKLEAAHDYLAAAPVVVRVARDLPMPQYDDRLPAEVRDPERLVALCERWGLESPVNRVLVALGVRIGD